VIDLVSAVSVLDRQVGQNPVSGLAERPGDTLLAGCALLTGQVVAGFTVAAKGECAAKASEVCCKPYCQNNNVR
jgi:hypothetical protein